MDLAVAIINYNTREQLRRCLDALPARLHGEKLPVMVIDNASSDGSAPMVATQYRNRVRLLANNANIGFARAVNQALASSDTRYLLVLNADVEAREGAIAALRDFMERSPDVGIAGGKLVDSDGNLQYSCRRFYTPGAILMRRTPLGTLMPRHRALRDHLMLDWDHAEAREVDWLQGACLMIRREAIEAVGGMDERFFLYFEDVDLARRLPEAGYKVSYVPDAEFVHHYRRGSSGGVLNLERLHHLTSGLRYLSKWSGRWQRLLGLGQHLALLMLLGLDLVLINGGFLLCILLRDRLGGPLPHLSTRTDTYLPLLYGANPMLLLAMLSSGMYRVERSSDWLASLASVVKAVTWVALAGAVVLFFAPSYRSGFIYSRLLLLLFYVYLIGAFWLTRLMIKAVFKAFWRQHLLLRRILVVGNRAASQVLRQAISAEPGTGYEVADVLEMETDGTEDLDPSSATRFRDSLDRLHPGGVVFVARRHAFRASIPLVLESLDRGMEVRLATSGDVFPYMAERSGEICGQPAADVTRTPAYGVKRYIKRLTDLLLASVGLVLMSPVLLVMAPIIRLQDGGPAFFLQDRFGKYGRPFRIIKLRTMRVGAELDPRGNVAEGPLTMIPNDPRVTPLGRWLRKHKVDELPQLLNVILGHMSLVGPRPPMAEEVHQYKEWQKGRLFVRPGLTGLWQIDKQRKWRFNEMVELDLQYILNWSLLVDFSVILRTVPAVLRGS